MSRVAPPPFAGRRGKNHSLFFRDLSSSPAVAAKSSSPAVEASAGWRERHAVAADQLPPPPPLFSLEDRMEASPEVVGAEVGSFGSSLFSPQPVQGFSLLTPSPAKPLSSPSLDSYGLWRSPLAGPGSADRLQNGEQRRQQGSPFKVLGQEQQAGVVLDSVASHREIVRPEAQNIACRAAVPYSGEGEEWVTVFGFGVDETNLVLREFQKCGPILNWVPGPGNVNWIHLQYQTGYDAQNALRKNGMQLNSALIVGVKPLDRLQRLALTQALPSKPPSFVIPPPRPPGKGSAAIASSQPASRPYYLSAGEPRAPKSAASLASPVKSTFSKLVDLLFGV